MKNFHQSVLQKKPFAFAAGFIAALVVSSQSAMAQPAIANVYPNGSYQFQSTNSLGFTATSSAGIANISVTLTSTSLFGIQGFPQTYTSSSGLTISGNANNENVSAPLTSNTVYSAKIVVTDVNNASTTNNLSFDTISPGYTWEAVDWDYTSNSVSGLFIDNPQTNAYAGLASTSGVDYNNPNAGGAGDGTAAYRPQGLETETQGDVPRLAYSPFTTNIDHDVGYNNGGPGGTPGNWGNYTRHYPAGVYNVFVRASDGNGAQHNAGDISVTAGTASFANTGPYYFSVQATGWQTYKWYSLVDSSNNPALLTIPNDGTASTLRLTIDGGSCNEHFFMLVPANTNPPVVGAGYISSAYPNGTNQFQGTNTFDCTIISTNGVNNIVAQVAGANISGTTFTQTLTPGSGLTVTGNTTNKDVSFALNTDSVYSVTFLITDGANNGSVTNLSFDTVNPNYYTWEAEDWDFSGGQHFENPQIDSYYFNSLAEANIDSYCPNGPKNANDYLRGSANDNINLNTEAPGGVGGDTLRLQYLQIDPNTSSPYADYDVGFTAGGQWANYTRTFPSGVYNIYVRAADGGGSSSDAGSFSLVTSGVGTESQTLSQIGTWNVPATGNWQKYTWCLVLNSGGYPARFYGSNGVAQTLRMTLNNANCNLNYYMLVPANLSLNPPPFVGNFSPDGSAIFQPSNQVSFVVNSSVGINTNNIVLYLNGVQETGLTISGNQFAYNVTFPIQSNKMYNAVVTLSDTAGSSAYTNSFATFSSSDYQWEAEDYDYTSNGISGLYIENAVDAYAGLGGTSGIDCLESDPNGISRGFTYRPQSAADFPDTTSGDSPRTQFTSAGKTDYSIGSFGPNSWANYTRHYPAGTYNVIGRFAEGAAVSHANLSILTSGYGTTPQTTNFLGTFVVPLGGWSSWEWATLVDANGNPVRVTLDGSQQTLQLEGSSNGSEPEVNVNFFMLAAVPPSPTITASVSAGKITLSFPVQSAYTYELMYSDNLTNPTWTQVPGSSIITGTTGPMSVTDTMSSSTRFYRLQIH